MYGCWLYKLPSGSWVREREEKGKKGPVKTAPCLQKGSISKTINEGPFLPGGKINTLTDPFSAAFLLQSAATQATTVATVPKPDLLAVLSCPLLSLCCLKVKFRCVCTAKELFPACEDRGWQKKIGTLGNCLSQMYHCFKRTTCNFSHYKSLSY